MLFQFGMIMDVLGGIASKIHAGKTGMKPRLSLSARVTHARLRLDEGENRVHIYAEKFRFFFRYVL